MELIRRYLSDEEDDSVLEYHRRLGLRQSRLVPDSLYTFVSHWEIPRQAPGNSSQDLGERVIEALLDEATRPEPVTERLYEVWAALPPGVAFFFGSIDEPRKAVIKRTDETPLVPRHRRNLQFLRDEAPFESPQEVLDFFQACEDLPGPGLEPDWDVHLRVINESRGTDVVDW